MRDTFIMIPTAATDTIRLEPPALINGSAFPANGSSASITDMLMKASMTNQRLKPATISDPSPSGARRAIPMPRQKIMAYKPTSIVAPITPVSSPTTAKMLSVGGTGRPGNLVLAFPIPTPKQPPQHRRPDNASLFANHRKDAVGWRDRQASKLGPGFANPNSKPAAVYETLQGSPDVVRGVLEILQAG